MKRDIENFLNYPAAKGFADNTLLAYRNDLSQFQIFVEQQAEKQRLNPDWSAVDRSLLLSYILDLKGRRYTPATVARKVAAIKSLFGYLLDEGLVEHNPTDNLGSPRVGRAMPKSLSSEEVQELLQQPEKLSTPEARRDKAMLELLYASGVRVSELVSFDVEDINLGQNSVRCRGRRSSQRIIPLPPQVTECVARYLKESRPHLLHHREEKALFLNRRGERLTRQGFWQILKGYTKAAHLDPKVAPHTLRHSFAVHMLNKGADLQSVQELLGHASISTTEVYTHLSQPRLGHG